MPVAVEPKLAKLFIVEDKVESVPFIVHIKGVGSSKTRSLYSIAVDASWSMDGSKIFKAKEAVIQMLKNLNSEDLVTVYSFNGRVSKVVDMVKASSYEAISSYVADIKLGGGTNIYGALEGVYRDYLAALDRGEKVDSFKLIMVTDGVPTTGIKDVDKIVNLAKRLGEHVSVSLIVGVGNDYNERLLMNIATNTKGFFEHLSDPSKIPTMFEKMTTRYRELSAKSLKLFIKTAPGASVYVYNRPAYTVRGGVEVDVGDVYNNDTVDVVGEIVLPPQRKGLLYVASITTNYTDIDGNNLEMPALTLSVPCLSKPSVEHLNIDERLFKEFNIVKIASIIAKDIYGSNSMTELRKALDELVNATLTVNRRELYSRTIDIKAHLEQEGLSPEVVKKIVSLISRIVSGRLE